MSDTVRTLTNLQRLGTLQKCYCKISDRAYFRGELPDDTGFLLVKEQGDSWGLYEGVIPRLTRTCDESDPYVDD